MFELVRGKALIISSIPVPSVVVASNLDNLRRSDDTT